MRAAPPSTRGGRSRHQRPIEQEHDGRREDGDAEDQTPHQV